MLSQYLENGKVLTKHLLKINFIALAIAGLCTFLDQRASQTFSWQKTYEIYWTARHTTDLGLSQHYFVGAALLFFYFWLIGPKIHFPKISAEKMAYYKNWSLQFFSALVVSGVWMHLIKFCVGRMRPHISAPKYLPFVFKPFHGAPYNSFPSGHAQSMFTFATMMILAFPKQKWLWLFLATYICVTRVIVHDHFISDTVYGACVGYTGTMVTLFFMKKK
jgi:membrane-associated phospholipid phosphatase